QSIDIDGDGKPDSIVFEGKRGGDIFTVTVNGVRYDGNGDYIRGTYAIVDIDSTDGLREIAIPESGPSDDYATTFLIYSQGKIKKIGKIPGTYYLKTDGTGIIQTMVRGEILHTWFFPAAFVLDENHTPRMVEQPLYLMKVPKMGFSGFTIGAECTAKSNFPLQASPTDSRIIATLTPGKKFTVVASDNKKWCIVQTSFGILGWFEVVRYNIVLPLRVEAELLMDGLCQAD
ncbi:MAG: SH3 domain-containing protein, partial [Candidatus Latescibacterota bacterium]